MRTDDFDFIARFLKEQSGLVITPDKAYLLESRLMPIARRRNLKSVDDLIQVLRVSREQVLGREIVEAMTTNESFFFRDVRPFEQFKELVLPHLLQTRADKKSFRIWSAAASSGQECYSLAMILKEEANRLAGWKIDIIGTDISTEMLNKAKAGLYTQFEVQRGLPIQYLVKYFKKKDEAWEIDPVIRSMVQYREHNLLHDLRSLGQFDVVFCRNVLIYFDQPTKTKVLDNVARQMPADGFLYLGGAETVLGISESFKPISGQRGIYGLCGGKSGGLPSQTASASQATSSRTPAASSGLAPKSGSPAGMASSSAPGISAPKPSVSSVGLGSRPSTPSTTPFGGKK